jgi:hypothetical protein
MDRRFFTLVASLSGLTCGGVWLATGSADQSAAADLRSAVPGASIYYPGCHAARSAGATPLLRGEPGYRSEMDGDGDGIACEVYAGGGGGRHFRHRRGVWRP